MQARQVRGENWAMTERLAQNGSAAFHRYDELLGKENPVDIGLSDKQKQEKTWNGTIELFTAFLNTKLRMDRREKSTLKTQPSKERWALRCGSASLSRTTR